jgi:hypothetical protein
MTADPQFRLMVAGFDLLDRALTREPDCCAMCVHWRGKDGATYGHCPIVDWDTADSSTCTRFELKARLNAHRYTKA